MSRGFLFDTNVLSELMRAKPSARVLSWVDARTEGDVFTSAINQAEILAGIALLPNGRKRDELAPIAEMMFTSDFAGRCLDFGSDAAWHYASVRAERKAQGRPISTEDAQIAAVALAHQLVVVTRNAKDFIMISDLELVDPWQTQ